MDAYILSGARTANGGFLGAFSNVPATQLGGTAIAAAVAKSGVNIDQISDCFMGHVIQAGCGQAPARQAALNANLPNSVTCTTVNKVCGSGMKAIELATNSIRLGENEVAIAGGMENMSLAPHLIPGSRLGTKFGPTKLQDAIEKDGLTDASSEQAMGIFAEECAKKYNFSREEQDAFAIESYKRAQNASKKGYFRNEITPVKIEKRKSEEIITEDEGPKNVNFEKIPKLKPAFIPNGTITAANASSINDGAAAIVIASEKYRRDESFKIVSIASYATDPAWFTIAPITAMERSLSKANLKVSDIDLFEINEAFSVVPMVAMKEMSIHHSRVNIYGGAVSLGHPIGQSGTRIVVTLMNAMKRENYRYGLASICIGGGEALSLIIERAK